jgi:hypothetical protein
MRPVFVRQHYDAAMLAKVTGAKGQMCLLAEIGCSLCKQNLEVVQSPLQSTTGPQLDEKCGIYHGSSTDRAVGMPVVYEITRNNQAAQMQESY